MEAEVGDLARGSAHPRLIDPRALARAVARGAALGGLLLAGAAVAVLTLALSQHGGLAGVLGGVLGVPRVGVAGLLVGGAYGSTRALRSQLPLYDDALGRALQPLLAHLVARLPLPPEGLSVDAFNRLLDQQAGRLTAESAGTRRRPLRRWGARVGLRLIRATLERRFLSGLRERGERVTAERLERFAGERLVDLLLADTRARLAAAHYVAAALAAVLVLGPLLWMALAR